MAKKHTNQNWKSTSTRLKDKQKTSQLVCTDGKGLKKRIMFKPREIRTFPSINSKGNRP